MKKTRWVLLIIGVTLFWLALEANLFRLQVARHSYFEKLAKRQYMRKVVLHAQRGIIYDHAGNPLVSNVIKYDLAADPKVVRNKDALSRLCAQLFDKPQSYFTKKLAGNSRFVYLARKVTADELNKVLALHDPGVIKIPVFRRNYFYGEYAAQLIGFTDPDGRGLSGLELQYNDLLQGINGSAVLQYVPGGKLFYNTNYPIQPSRDGKNIYLTIDKNIQTVVEQALRKGVQKAKAHSGMCVVLDPNNGRVLAMANYPSFDPNHPQKYSAFVRKNRTITDVFEPGSTIKPFIAATLLQERKKRPGQTVFCNLGRYRFHDKTFTDSHPHGTLTFKDVVAYSSNIGMIKLTQDLPANTLFRYLKSFGFATETGIELEGEASGFLSQPAVWSSIRKASVSIGYGIGITALQLANAYAALVNGGKLYRPYVVSKIENPDGSLWEEHEPTLIRQNVISPRISQQIKTFLQAVVEKGTGKKAAIPGVLVGGKTGTAKKVRPEGGYYSRKYLALFVGTAPLDAPRYVCAVIVDEPQTYFYGGQVAAPIFKEIMERILNLDESAPQKALPENKNPEIYLVNKEKSIPDLKGFTRVDAIRLLEAKDADYETEGEGEYVIRSYKKDGEIILQLGSKQLLAEKMPKLTGLTLREALARLDLSKIRVKIQGDPAGIIYRQSIPPNRKLKKAQQLVLTCRLP